MKRRLVSEEGSRTRCGISRMEEDTEDLEEVGGIEGETRLFRVDIECLNVGEAMDSSIST